MRKAIISVLVLSTIGLVGCGGVRTTPIAAGIYNGTTGPGTVTSNSGDTKTGEAVCTGVLGIAGWGDCSIDTAAKNGGIKQIKSVDYKHFDVLGIYYTVTTVVKGN